MQTKPTAQPRCTVFTSGGAISTSLVTLKAVWDVQPPLQAPRNATAVRPAAFGSKKFHKPPQKVEHAWPLRDVVLEQTSPNSPLKHLASPLLRREEEEAVMMMVPSCKRLREQRQRCDDREIAHYNLREEPFEQLTTTQPTPQILPWQ